MIAPLLISILALIVGLIGFTYEWPMIYGIEGQQIAAAIRFAYRPQFDHFCCLTYPPLYFYLLMIVYKTIGAIGQTLGYFSNFDDVVGVFLIDPGRATLISRLISLFAFVLSVIGIYKTSKMIGGLLGGVVASLLAIATPSLVIFAKTGQSEMLMVALITWSLFYSCRLLLGQGKNSDLVMATMLASLAIGIKYNAALVLTPILIYLLTDRKGLKSYLIVGVVGLAVFMTTHPFIPKLIFSRYYFDLVRINPTYALERLLPPEMKLLASNFKVGNHEKQIHVNTWLWTLQLFRNREGLLVWWCLAGMIVALGIKKRLWLALIMLVVGHWLWVSQLKGLDNEFHYLLPLYPAALILSGVGIGRLMEKLRFKGFLLILFILIWGHWLFKPIFASQLELTKPSTNSIAADWLTTRLSKNQIVVRGHQTPLKLINPLDSIIMSRSTFSPNLKQKIDDVIKEQIILTEEVFRYDKPEADWPSEWNQEKIDNAKKEVFLERLFKFAYLTVDELIAKKVSYVVLSSYEIELINQPSNHVDNSELDYLYKRSQKAYREFLEDPRIKEVITIYPNENNRGPLIKIYEINP